MLNRLKLENFKAWREADLKLGKVTGFFDTNSAGKSSLLQFLLLLKQTRNATDRGLVLDFGGPAALTSLGTFTDVVHRHDEESRIRWLLDWTLPSTLEIRDPMKPRHDPLFKGNRLQTSCEVSLSQGRLLPHELVYRFSDVEFWLQPQPDPEEQFELGTDSQQFRFTRTQGRPWPLHHPVKTYLFPNEVRSYY